MSDIEANEAAVARRETEVPKFEKVEDTDEIE